MPAAEKGREDLLDLLLGNPRTRVPDFERERARSAPGSDQHAALARVVQGVLDQIPQHPRKQDLVGHDQKWRGLDHETQAALLGQGPEFTAHPLEQILDRDGTRVRSDRRAREPDRIKHRLAHARYLAQVQMQFLEQLPILARGVGAF